MKDFEGKVAIITGASRGIGRIIAKQLAGLGVNVVVNYSSSPDMAAEVVEDIIQHGGKAIAIQADISKASEVEKLLPKPLPLWARSYPD